jgi:hypothetical protein
MKRIILISFAILISIVSRAQESPEQILKSLEQNDTTQVSSIDTLKHDTKMSEQIEIEKEVKKTEGDTTRIRFGNRKIVIIEKDGTTAIEIPERDAIKKDDWESKPSRGSRNFKGHWAGFEWGFNGYMDPNHSINMTGDMKFMELKQGRSWNINLNIMQYSLGFGTDKAGLVTGLGFEFNDYHFRNQTSFKVINGITSVDSSYILDPNKNVTKSKFSMSHLTIPLLFEFQIPTGNDRHRIFFSTGVIGGVKLTSHTKVEYEGTTEGKDKVKNDFNFSPFRYGITARIGYRGLKLFANYYLTPLFEKGKGPSTELYPFSAGLILLSFR